MYFLYAITINVLYVDRVEDNAYSLYIIIYNDLFGHAVAYEQPHYNNKMHARRTTDDDGRQPIVIGHLRNSGNLKINSKHRKL